MDSWCKGRQASREKARLFLDTYLYHVFRPADERMDYWVRIVKTSYPKWRPGQPFSLVFPVQPPTVYPKLIQEIDQTGQTISLASDFKAQIEVIFLRHLVRHLHLYLIDSSTAYSWICFWVPPDARVFQVPHQASFIQGVYTNFSPALWLSLIKDWEKVFRTVRPPRNRYLVDSDSDEDLFYLQLMFPLGIYNLIYTYLELQDYLADSSQPSYFQRHCIKDIRGIISDYLPWPTPADFEMDIM